MSEPDMSEDIKKFSSNKEIIELINTLWNLTDHDNSNVEYILTLCTGKTDEDVILNLEHKIEKLELDKLEQNKSKKGGERRKRKRPSKKSKKSLKKSRKNKKSLKKENK